MTDAEKSHLVQGAQSAEELFAVFDAIGVVAGTSKEYTPDRMKEKYMQLRFLVMSEGENQFAQIPFSNLTRSHGIRAKAMELLYYELHEI